MTSTDVFYAVNSTLTVHMPPGSAEAVLMIESLDNVVSITLPLDEVKRLVSTLKDRADASGTADSRNIPEAKNPMPLYRGL